MRILVSGNEAIAAGAVEAGFLLGAGYPGTPSTEILESYSRYPGIYAEWCPNEKVALEVAIGASYAGVRSFATMKHVGLNVAADPFMTAVYAGVNAALVVVTADDPGMHSSQNEQDNRHFARLAHAPLVEPSDPDECYRFVRIAAEISEQFDTPILFRTTTRVAHSRQGVELLGSLAAENAESLTELRKNAIRPLERSAEKYVMVPANARRRKHAVLERMRRLREYSEASPLNVLELGSDVLGVITSGVAYHYVKEVFPEASILKLGFSYPLPEKLIRELASHVSTILVVEEIDPVVETEVRALGIPCHGKDVLPEEGELTADDVEAAIGRLLKDHPSSRYTVRGSFGGHESEGATRDVLEKVSAFPQRSPVLCPGCGHRTVFYVLRKLRAVVTGDIGCYTLAAGPPLSAIDTCVCMGASIGEAHGAVRAREKAREIDENAETKKFVAVIGDSTFVHSGITALINSVYNHGNEVIVILDNRTTAMTGHQPHPATGRTLLGEETHELDLAELARAVGARFVETVDAYDMKALESVLRAALEAEGVAVVIARRPCVLTVKELPLPYEVHSAACTGCRLCLRLGCPALMWEDGKARILEHLCTGCGACAALCRFDAIHQVGVESTEG